MKYLCCFFSMRVRHSWYALVTGVQTFSLPICREPFGDRLDPGGEIARFADAEAEARERDLGDRHRAAVRDMGELPDHEGDRIAGAGADDIDDAAEAEIADRKSGV